MALDLARVRAAVARNTTVDGSAREYIRSVPQLIRDAIAADDLQDATHLNALVEEMESSTDGLMADLTANTSSGGGTEGGGGEGGGTEPAPEGGGSR